MTSMARLWLKVLFPYKIVFKTMVAWFSTKDTCAKMFFLKSPRGRLWWRHYNDSGSTFREDVALATRTMSGGTVFYHRNAVVVYGLHKMSTTSVQCYIWA